MPLKFRALRFIQATLFAVASLLCCQLQAQVTGATVTGTVSDSGGNVVAGAKVTLTSGEQGTKRSVEANARGDYSVPNVSPGSYRLEVSSPGDRKSVV